MYWKALSGTAPKAVPSCGRLAVVAIQPRFRIEGVHMRDAALHEQEDNALGPRAEGRLLAGQWPVMCSPGQQAGLLQ